MLLRRPEMSSHLFTPVALCLTLKFVMQLELALMENDTRSSICDYPAFLIPNCWLIEKNYFNPHIQFIVQKHGSTTNFCGPQSR